MVALSLSALIERHGSLSTFMSVALHGRAVGICGGGEGGVLHRDERLLLLRLVARVCVYHYRNIKPGMKAPPSSPNRLLISENFPNFTASGFRP